MNRKLTALLLAALASILLSSPVRAAGELAVIQADASASNTTCSVLKLDPNAAVAPLATIAIPGVGASAIRVSGSATSTLYGSNSADETLFTFTGANNTDTVANANTLNPRAVVTVDSLGVITIATTYTASSGNQTRCATTIDNANWYIADQGGQYSNLRTAASPVGNFRGAKTFGGDVFLSTQSTVTTNIQVGTTSALVGGSYTGLPGLTNNASHNDFYLIQSASGGGLFDLLYVIGNTSASAGTITKYSLVGASWVANGSYTTNFGGFGLAARRDDVGGGAFLYATSGTGATTANKVIKLTDLAGYNATINITTASNLTLYTAPAGKIIKGVAFFPLAPGSVPPSNLVITAVNGGNPASVNSPFSVVVQAQTAAFAPAGVLANTDVTLSLTTGSGTLAGTLTGTLLAGQSSLTLTAVTYDTIESGVVVTASRTSGDLLVPGDSAPFTVLEGANHLAFVTVPLAGTFNVPLSLVAVEALRSDGTPDLNYNGTVTIANNGGPGTLTGTLAVAAAAGLASFTDLREDAAGDYTFSASATGLAGDVSSNVRVSGLEEILLPRFIQGKDGTNTNRIPYAFRLKLTYLKPNSTYRYFNQIVVPTDPDSTSGAGNCIFALPGAFIRTTGPSLASAGNYAEFTTDSSGDYTGWFVTEPTGNARFVEGNQLRMRLMLNDGSGGTSVAQRLSTANTATVKYLGAALTSGSGIRGNSFGTPQNFVFLYDNVAGTGRPLSGTMIESDGTVNSVANSYTAFYATSVDGVAGGWGAVIPNDLPTGVERIESRTLATGDLEGCAATDADGVWPGGANTVNPSSGTTALVITAAEAPFNSVPDAVCMDTTAPLGAAGTASISPADVDGGSTDVCGIASRSVAPRNFTCADLGPRSVTLTVVNVNTVSDSCSATATVVDLLSPTIVGVGPVGAVECPGAPVFSAPTAADNCSASLGFSDARTSICGGSYVQTRTWTATDTSGNGSTASQAITVEDTTLPVVTKTTIAACYKNTIDAQTAALVATTATDTCSPPVTTTAATAGTCAATVTVTGSDLCGNAASVNYSTRIDGTAPVLVGVPADETVECDGVPAAATPTATDVCDGAPTIAFTETRKDGSCLDAYKLTRTWTTSDSCANSSSQSQVVTVEDNTAPTPTAWLTPAAPLAPRTPSSVCLAPTSRAFTVGLSATDSCDPTPVASAVVRVVNHDVARKGAPCVERIENFPVTTGETVEFHLVPPPCPVKPPKAPRPAMAVDSRGIKVFYGETVVLVGTADDRCGNRATTIFDPAVEPSALCDEVLIDKTCCPAIGTPEIKECKVAVCGR